MHLVSERTDEMAETGEGERRSGEERREGVRRSTDSENRFDLKSNIGTFAVLLGMLGGFWTTASKVGVAQTSITEMRGQLADIQKTQQAQSLSNNDLTNENKALRRELDEVKRWKEVQEQWTNQFNADLKVLKAEGK